MAITFSESVFFIIGLGTALTKKKNRNEKEQEANVFHNIDNYADRRMLMRTHRLPYFVR
jgi:hypothetical protein